MKEDKAIHNTRISVEGNHFLVTTDTRLKSNRAVSCKSIRGSNGDKVELRCNTIFLREMVDKGDKKGIVNLKCGTDDKLPILVEYPDKPNEIKSTKEKFHIVFAKTKE